MANPLIVCFGRYSNARIIIEIRDESIGTYVIAVIYRDIVGGGRMQLYANQLDSYEYRDI